MPTPLLLDMQDIWLFTMDCNSHVNIGALYLVSTPSSVHCAGADCHFIAPAPLLVQLKLFYFSTGTLFTSSAGGSISVSSFSVFDHSFGSVAT